MTREPTVYVVDDDDAVRDALAMMLRAAGRNVLTFPSADAFMRQDDGQLRGCLVLDVRMPGTSGLELQEWLEERRSTLPIVFLTGHGDVPMAVRAVKRGAFDFLQKPVDDAQLMAAIDAALAHDAAMEAAASGDNPLLASLTRREREVLDLILAGQKSREIADALFISIKTVEFHRSRIHAKLGVASMAELFTRCLGGPQTRLAAARR